MLKPLFMPKLTSGIMFDRARRRARRAATRMSSTTCWIDCAILSGDRVFRRRQRQLERHDTVGHEARVLRLQPHQALHHQPGADHQHHRQGDLGDDERAACALRRRRSWRRAPPCRAGSRSDSTWKPWRAGRHAEQNGRHHRHRQRDDEHLQVDRGSPARRRSSPARAPGTAAAASSRAGRRRRCR